MEGEDVSDGPSPGKLHLSLKPGKLWSLLALGAVSRWATHNCCSCFAVSLRMKSKLRTNPDGKGRTWILVDILEGLNQPAFPLDFLFLEIINSFLVKAA